MDLSLKNMLLSNWSNVVEHKNEKRKSHLIHATASSTVHFDIYLIVESVEECNYIQLWKLTQLSILDTLSDLYDRCIESDVCFRFSWTCCYKQCVVQSSNATNIGLYYPLYRMYLNEQVGLTCQSCHNYGHRQIFRYLPCSKPQKICKRSNCTDRDTIGLDWGGLSDSDDRPSHLFDGSDFPISHMYGVWIVSIAGEPYL
ncbi:hypothetical protein BDV41DRAFT_157421 [Aspergillus transmontanensis]|uniref:Uncharacterized protein n=1 Tax=Aspergillus transmontanensis TaxID=1034304 RepID=A0A5N6WFN4_9EURO|nr:hypothetical protein BDV41DRAFT_157421 [Aspergillus transmontanensis]